MNKRMDKEDIVCMCVYIHTHIYTKCVYTHTHIYTYTHIYTKCVYIHTHTYIQNGILLGHKKEQNNAICSNKDGPKDLY